MLTTAEIMHRMPAMTAALFFKGRYQDNDQAEKVTASPTRQINIDDFSPAYLKMMEQGKGATSPLRIMCDALDGSDSTQEEKKDYKCALLTAYLTSLPSPTVGLFSTTPSPHPKKSRSTKYAGFLQRFSANVRLKCVHARFQ